MVNILSHKGEIFCRESGVGSHTPGGWMPGSYPISRLSHSLNIIITILITIIVIVIIYKH